MMTVRSIVGLWPAKFRRSPALRWLAAGGLAWVAAGGMLVAVLGRSEQLASQRAASAATLVRASHRPAPREVAQTVRLSDAQRFRAEFPAMDTRQTRLRALLESATRRGLRWQRVELRQTLDKSIGLARYEITLPLSGSYMAVRQLVDDALAGDAGLALDQLQLRRPSASSPDVEATAVWSLWMADGANPATPSAAP